MLLSGSRAAMRLPQLPVENLSCMVFEFFAPNFSFIVRAQMRRAARSLPTDSSRLNGPTPPPTER